MMDERRIRPEGADGRRVCSDCFADPHLKREIEGLADSHSCDYCGAEGEGVRAAPLEEVAEYMLGQIDIEYASADQSLPNDPETKNRMFPEDEFDTAELLENHIELELPNDDGTLMSHLRDATRAGLVPAESSGNTGGRGDRQQLGGLQAGHQAQA